MNLNPGEAVYLTLTGELIPEAALPGGGECLWGEWMLLFIDGGAWQSRTALAGSSWATVGRSGFGDHTGKLSANPGTALSGNVSAGKSVHPHRHMGRGWCNPLIFGGIIFYFFLCPHSPGTSGRNGQAWPCPGGARPHESGFSDCAGEYPPGHWENRR